MCEKPPQSTSYEDLHATVKRRKLKWYGLVTRSDGLTKVILQGTVDGLTKVILQVTVNGKRRRSRPRKKWI